MIRIRFALLALALSGCTTAPHKTNFAWTHPTADESQLRADRDLCVADAETRTVGASAGEQADIDMRKAKMIDSCMQVRGYTWSPVP
jgi:starvation-inducible outer membrane lipoprotein